MTHFWIFFAALLAVTSAQAAPAPPHSAGPDLRYTVTDLGLSYDWEIYHRTHCLNNKGQVIAEHGVGSKDGPDYGPNEHTFLWGQGHWRDTGDGRGYHTVEGDAINDGGQIVGMVVGPQPLENAFVFGRAFSGRMGAIRLLGTLPPDTEAAATAINNRGEIVGYTFRPYIPTHDHPDPTRAFLLRHGHMTGIGGLTGDDSSAVDINDRGQVVGDAGGRVFLWHNGHRKDLGPLGEAVAINSSGQVLIQYAVSEPGKDEVERGHLWQNGKVRDLGSLPGLALVEVDGLNDNGQVVGRASDRAFIWQKGRMHDISRVKRGWQLQEAYAINNRGQIVADGVHGDDEHLFLLTPQ